jgi:myo-inositol-1(or 4)-monophosphatase
MKLFKDFTNISQGVRRLGSAAADLCYVACGKADGFWEIGLQPWDSAAGVLLIMEAGGKVSRMDGKPFTIHDQHLLATNGYLHKEMLGKTVPAIASISDQD